MNTLQNLLTLFCAAVVGSASAQTSVFVTQGEESDLAATYDTTDLLAGLIPRELPGDRGWHPVNTDPLDQLPAFTDGLGDRATGLSGLLSDFPDPGQPAKLVEYALPLPCDIREVRVFTGNEGRDGRVFHTYTVRFSSDGGRTFTDPIYVQSHPSGTMNNPNNNQWRVVLSQLTSSTGWLATGVTHLEFDFYAVDNTQGEMRDPFDGVNPFTSTDDGLPAAFVSPLVWEIDVLGTDSPPLLSARKAGANLELTWLSRATNCVVQATSQLSPAHWANLEPQPVIQRDGVTNQTSVAATGAPRFLRLSIQP